MVIVKRKANSSDDNAKHRQKLADIRYRLPFITQSALAALCKWSKENGDLPDVQSRTAIIKVSGRVH